MIVDVILLRREGERILRRNLPDAPAVRGRLFVRSARSVWHGKPESVAVLADPADSMRTLLPILRGVRLVRVQFGSLLITGHEQIETQEGIHRRPAVMACRQTWWCRLVAGGAGTDPRPVPVFEPA